jgi:predicted RNase H-like HicB family nuclease
LHRHGKDTQASRKAKIRDTIEFHIEGLQARGEKIPEPTVEARTVSVLVD